MRLSNNEFLSLLKRALEGSGWSQGRYEEPAHAIWWLEAHGIAWLDHLPKVWPRLNQSESPKPELTKNHAADSVIDANFCSLLHCGPNSIDLAFANACDESLISLETRYCLDRIMIVPGLALLARRGANAVARWQKGDVLNIATVRAGALYPTYTQYDLEGAREAKSSSLFLNCSLDEDGLNHYYRNLSKLTDTHEVIDSRSPEQFADSAEFSMINGIEVADETLRILTEAGDRVLVEATEQSRKGAG